MSRPPLCRGQSYPPVMKRPCSNSYSEWLFLPLVFFSQSVFAQDFPSAPFLDPNKAITEYVHASWDQDEGLPQGSINAIEQTADGYVWLGTQEGLVRFDGIEFKVFNKHNVDAFQSNDIRVLERDQRGALWIGTLHAGIYRYRDGLFDNPIPRDSLLDSGITAILEGRQGQLWIGTVDQGLKVFYDGALIGIDLPFRSISSLHETKAGVLWIGTRGGGLLRYENGDVRVYTHADGLPDNDVTSLVAGQDGGIWVGTKSGLAHLHSDTFYVATTRHGLPANRINTLFEDDAGSLWIGTDKGGLARLRLDVPDWLEIGIATEGASNYNFMHARWDEVLSISSFASPNGLTYDMVKSLFMDREGNLLIGTDGGGLNLLRDGKFTMYTEKVGLPDDFVYAIHEDPFGAMWFSTEKGVGRLAEGAITTFSAADGLADDHVISIASTPDGSVWMGTYGKGLSRYRNGHFTRFTHNNGLPADIIYSLYGDSRGRLWIGTGGGAARMQRNELTVFTMEQGLSSNQVTVMLESHDNSVWIGTYDAGLNKVQGDLVVPFAAADELADLGILSLYEDAEGALWIGTYGEGLIRVKDEEVTILTTKQGLFNDTVLNILEDDHGNFWMTSNLGLFRVAKRQLDAFVSGEIDEIVSFNFGKGDGLRSNEFNGGFQPAGWKGRDGRLWFPSKVGVASIDPKRIRKNETPPMIEVESILADGEAIPLESGPLRSGISLKPGIDRVEINYAGLSLVSPERMHYQYQLIGTDKNWVEAGNRRTAYYNNLDPGAHLFRVRVMNSDGVWSQKEATLAVYHIPFFYQTNWFYVVCVCLAVFGMMGMFRLRTSQLQDQKLKLEREVNERTADLLTALEEKKEILSITSHDLKNPLSGFIGLSELVLEDFSEMQPNPTLAEGMESIQLMRNEAERMLRIVKKLLDMRRGKEGSSMHLNAADLEQIVSDVMCRHHAVAARKGIDFKFKNNGVLPVAFNEDALLRIADNLISNAVKFSPPGKTIWITLTMDEEWVRFMVQDEGPGLTDEDRAKVFGKLQQLSARPTAGEESNGLGLFIVKRLADEQGGLVGVTSIPGYGAAFWIKMPVSHTLIRENVKST